MTTRQAWLAERAARRCRWRRERPDEPGIYLRNNPAVRSVVRQDVIELEGRGLVTAAGADGSGLVSIEELDESFWWFGPVPFPWSRLDHPRHES